MLGIISTGGGIY